MTTLLDEPASRPATTPAQRLRNTMAAVRVSLQWLGVRKTLTPEQKNQAADTFGATGDYRHTNPGVSMPKAPPSLAAGAVPG